MRAKCGANKPINPMGPAAAVAPPASNAMAIKTTKRVLCGCAPIATAADSPIDNTSKARVLATAISSTTTVNGVVDKVASRVCDVLVPADHPRMLSSTTELVNSTAEVNPPMTAPSATPDSVIRTVLPRMGPVLPMAKTATEVVVAPAKDHHM